MQTIKENKTLKQHKNKERIDSIREDFKNLSYKPSKSELKDIKSNFYTIEKIKKISTRKTSKYLDKLDKRILELDKYKDYDDFEYKGIKDIENLFTTTIDKDYYKPKLVSSVYKNKYVPYVSKGDRILSIPEYFSLIETYLRELIDEYKDQGEWKLQLTAEIKFISLKPVSNEIRNLYLRSDNEEFMSGDDTDEIIKSLFQSFIQRYEENLQNKMKGSNFEFDEINFLYYDFNKTNIYRGGTYIDSPKWLKDKKSTINPKNKDNKCFQYAATLALNIDNIDNHLERISKIKPFINQYDWKDIEFPPTSKDWRKFESNNKIALNILYVPHNTKRIQVANRSKNNLSCDKQIILLMITDGEKWHYLTVKNLSGLLRGITSNHCGDFYCLNCFRSYRTKSKITRITSCSFDESKNKLNYYATIIIIMLLK